MTENEILSHVDHTLLNPAATTEEILQTCRDALDFSCASACIPPLFVAKAKEVFGSSLTLCTVIGFPNGTMTTPAKCFEAREAVSNGADEIDMVIPIGLLKEGRDEAVLRELLAVREATEGKILKVIAETCLLSQDEKKRICLLTAKSGADFIKTSTGFSTGGARAEDVALFRREVGDKLKIKAAGGIQSLADAEKFLSLGASRLGTSRIVKIIKQNRTGENHADRSY